MSKTMGSLVECPRCDGRTWVSVEPDEHGFDMANCPLCFSISEEPDRGVIGYIELPVSAFVAELYGEWVADYTNSEWPEGPDATYVGF